MVLALLLPACSETGVQSVNVGDTWPQPGLVDLDGNAVDASALFGKPQLINVWATWCKPCREEMPDLQQLAELVSESGVGVLGLSVDDDPNLVKEFLLKYRIKFPILRAPDRVVLERELGRAIYPATYLIAPDGRVDQLEFGPRPWSDPKLVAYLHAYANGDDIGGWPWAPEK